MWNLHQKPYIVLARAVGHPILITGVSGLAPEPPEKHLNCNNLQSYLYHPELYECLIPGENCIFIQLTH
jgi:hypothetical protein